MNTRYLFTVKSQQKGGKKKKNCRLRCGKVQKMHFAWSEGTDLPFSSAPNPQTVPRGGRSQRDHGKAFALQTPGKKSDRLILSLKTHNVSEADGKSKKLGFKFVWIILSLLELKTLGENPYRMRTVKSNVGASLVAQWLGVCLPRQGTRVRALVWEDPTCRGATRPVGHNY